MADKIRCTVCGHRLDTGPLKHYPTCPMASPTDDYNDPEFLPAYAVGLCHDCGRPDCIAVDHIAVDD